MRLARFNHPEATGLALDSAEPGMPLATVRSRTRTGSVETGYSTKRSKHEVRFREETQQRSKCPRSELLPASTQRTIVRLLR
jgi:hypothetical protein